MKLEREIVKVKCAVYTAQEYDMVIEYAVDDNGVRHKLSQNPCEQCCDRVECNECQAKVIATVLGE